MTDKQKNALYLMTRCLAAGMTLEGIAGMMINCECESVINPINVEDRYHDDNPGKTDADYTRMVDNNPGYDFTNDNGYHYGYGLMQWTYPTRKTKMRQFHQKRGVSIGDFDTQIDWFLYECKTEFPGVWSMLCSTRSPQDAAKNFCRIYENPSNAEAKAEYRAGKAQSWYDWLLAHKDEAPDDSPLDPQPAPDPAPAVPEKLTLRTIDKNCHGWPEVWLMQAALKNWGYNVVINGTWSDSLVAVVKDFQKAHGLVQDGVVGKNTWAVLLRI